MVRERPRRNALSTANGPGHLGRRRAPARSRIVGCAGGPPIDGDRAGAARGATTRQPRADLRRRGQPLRPARRRSAPRDPDRPAQGRARGRRPRRRLARPPGPRGGLAQRPRPDLGPGHPPRHPRGATGARGGRPRPPARSDGPHAGRRGPGPGGPARDGPVPARACRSCPSRRPAVQRLADRVAAALTEPPEPLATAVLLERHGAYRRRARIRPRPSTGWSSSRSCAGRGAMRC